MELEDSLRRIEDITNIETPQEEMSEIGWTFVALFFEF